MTPAASVILSAIREAAFYRDPADPLPWAERNMSVTMQGGGEVPLRFDYAPYWRQPFLDLFDPDVRELTLMWASRLGKTLVVRTAVGYLIAELPTDIGIMLPTSLKAQTFAKKEIQGNTINCCPPAYAILGDGTNRRDQSNTITQKRYSGCELRLCGSNSFDDIRTIIASFLWAEEIDAIKEHGQEIQGEEGDRLKAFDKRGDQFAEVKRVRTSYPGTFAYSRIWPRLKASDYRQWHVACPSCGFDRWIMERERDLRFEIAESDGRKMARNAVIECPECHEHHEDDTRHAMMLGGKWIASQAFEAGRRGYHANSLLWPHECPGGYLLKLAQDVLDAEQARNPERAKQVIVNADDAMPYKPPSEDKVKPSLLLSAREDYDGRIMLPESVLMVVAAVDFAGGTSKKTQMEIKGLATNMETYAIEYLHLEGEAGGPEIKKQIDAILERQYTHPTLGKIGISACAFDAGHWDEWVGAMTLGYPGRIPIKGFDSVPTAGRVSRLVLRQIPGAPKVKCYHLGVNDLKHVIYQQLRRAKGDRGYMHFPKTGDFNQAYFDGITAEDFMLDEEGAAHFSCPENTPNEPLDINAYIEWIRGLPAIRRLFAQRMKEIEKGSPAAPPPAVAVAPPHHPSRQPFRRRKNWATNW